MTSRSAHVRISILGATAALALGLTACAGGSTSGTGSPAGASGSGTGGASGSASTTSGSTAAGPAGDLTQLTSTLVAATARPTTVHIALTAEGASSASSAGSGAGDVRTKAGGTSDAFKFEVGSGATVVSMVYVDGAGYVKLPPAQQKDPSKPWVKVSDTSTDPVIKAISTAFDQVDTQSSLSQYATFLKSASNFKATGPAEVGGVSAQGYSFDIDPKDLPAAKQLGSEISKIGPIPTTMAVDDQGRPVQIVETISISGQTITSTVSLTNYGETVDFSAPPADQTTTG